MRADQDVVDETQQVLAALEHVIELLQLALGERRLLVALQELREAEDRVERGPELVAHRGQELALGRARRFGESAGRGELAARVGHSR